VHLGVENIDHVGAIGKAGYGWQTEVRKGDGTLVEPGSGEVGELCLKGDGIMECYYKNPEATAEVLRDGWLYTGDMAEIDKDGFIWLVDRKKDVIVMGGENLYPVQIEDFIHTNPAVKDVAVIGLPDARLGEIPCAIVEFKPDMEQTEDEMRAFCSKMPRYKRPRKYIFAGRAAQRHRQDRKAPAARALRRRAPGQTRSFRITRKQSDIFERSDIHDL
jgi:acyl-CoA synthetase (AMP-forming)/AMP-acid ligase II